MIAEENLQIHEKKGSGKIPTKKLRYSMHTACFEWKLFGFLCSEKIDYNNLKRNPIAKVQTLPIRDGLIKRAEERNDEWGIQVLGKLLACNDLVAEEAMYHLSCINNFRF